MRNLVMMMMAGCVLGASISPSLGQVTVFRPQTQEYIVGTAGDRPQRASMQAPAASGLVRPTGWLDALWPSQPQYQSAYQPQYRSSQSYQSYSSSSGNWPVPYRYFSEPEHSPEYTQYCFEWGRASLERAMQIDYGPEISASTPIEIYLNERTGRFGGYTFGILGGKRSNPTPTGNFTLKFKKIDQYSNRYDSPMPLAVFFTDQCAIHVGSLEDPSRGCIHADWDASAMLYRFSRPGVTRVVVYD
ncbi:MAG: L,D-transpeptidase [bacterium]|nr:L,D-transpeptidase [Candidatus Sumerlaeota bacterium]